MAAHIPCADDSLDGRPSSPDPSLLSSPASSAASVGDVDIDMSDLLLPASALERELFGVPAADSGATVVSAASCDEPRGEPVGARKRTRQGVRAPPVPEFLSHLLDMLRTPAHAGLIAWEVPSRDEPDHLGGGARGKGKLVVRDPEGLQARVLGAYYRHARYASFQRQLNYFGFKKRLHGGKKGKLSPCSYIHVGLTADAESLLRLKRRPPNRKHRKRKPKRTAGDEDEDEDRAVEAAPPLKKCRENPKNERRLQSKVGEKKEKEEEEEEEEEQEQENIDDEPPAPDENGPLRRQNSAAAASAAPQLQAIATASGAAASAADSPPLRQGVRAPTLLDLLSTSLPPSEVLFDDTLDESSLDADGVPAWITADGTYCCHNVDSALVDLAMIY